MKRNPKRLRVVLPVLGVAIALAASSLAVAGASSHREAPLISQDPVADNTDTYAYVAPDAPDKVTLVGNWIPLEEPAGGPNFPRFGDDVLYKFEVDNNGDAVSDVTYEFRFQTHTRNPNTFLYNTGPITSLNDPDWNVRQKYSIAEVRNGHRTFLAAQHPDAAGEHRAPVDAELQPARDRRRSLTCRAGSRSSPGSATTRSSSISDRCSTSRACVRSTRPT